jgi:hypothetical protein
MMTLQANGSAMTDNENQRPAGQNKDGRRERLKLALRENLKRRKSQARGRVDFTSASSASDEVVRESDDESPG